MASMKISMAVDLNDCTICEPENPKIVAGALFGAGCINNGPNETVGVVTGSVREMKNTPTPTKAIITPPASNSSRLGNSTCLMQREEKQTLAGVRTSIVG